LQLTDSGLALGITNALQFGPLVFFGLYGGVIADRFDRRRLPIVTQSALALLAAAIGLLVATDLVQLWMIWVAALLLGLIMCVDKPALLAFGRPLDSGTNLYDDKTRQQCRVTRPARRTLNQRTCPVRRAQARRPVR
jgi:MFS family permease